jgi:hypothetical protein
VSCASFGKCTAVGSYLASPDASTESAVIGTESAGKWSSAFKVELPGNAKGLLISYLSAISCPSSGNCLAVGNYFVGTRGEPFVVTESSGIWGTGVEVHLPGNTSTKGLSIVNLSSVTCTLVTSCVAVGQYDTSTSQGLIETETSGTWSTAQALMPNDRAASTGGALFSVACASGGGCEAVGWYSNAKGVQPVALSEVSGVWARGVKVTPPGNATTGNASEIFLGAVACPSATSCVAGGGYNTAHGGEPFFVSESNGTWAASTEALLPPAALTRGQSAAVQAIACWSTTSCIAGGYYDSATDARDISAVTFTTAIGRPWTRGSNTSLPQGAVKPSAQESSVNGASCPASARCTIVGTYLDSNSQESFAATPATAPTAPHIKRVTSTVGGFQIVITAPESNGGSKISTYQYSIDGGTIWKNRSTGTTATTIELTKLAAHHTYKLAVRAVTVAGISQRSNVVSATTK